MILYLLKLLAVPQSQFVFIRADVIEPRLQRALQQLHSEDYCVFLPLQALLTI